VHIALPSDVARQPDRQAEDPSAIALTPDPPRAPSADAIARMAAAIEHARRPVLILGLDLNPSTDAPAVRRFAEALGVPVFVTPKAKGIFPEDHPLFYGVCSGLAADAVVVDFFAKSDLLIGAGFDPVESDKIWHQTMKLVSIAPVTIAAGEYRPALEVTGEVGAALTMLTERGRFGAKDWTREDERAFRADLERTLVGREGREQQEGQDGKGLSALAVTRCLRDLFPPETIVSTDVGSIKLIVSQAWRSTRPMTFLESNGLSSMGYSLPAAMAAKLAMPDRPVLCTMGDGGFSMVFADLETCVRRNIPFVTVVYNDCALSLIQVAQERRGHADNGVRYGHVNFAAASAALGAWSRRVNTLEELADAVKDARAANVPAVIEVPIDPSEYRAHAR
jgi:acetolactate synthase-1/2/3 large subunit